jgi:tetratricopeptide (TPR) repeat protein
VSHPHETLPGQSGGLARPSVRQIGSYEVLTLLGEGSTGQVFLARRPGIERLFALKLVHHGMDANGIARLKREAQLASRLDHPNIVRALDLGQHAGQLYLVMDHVPGPTLQATLDSGGTPNLEAALDLLEPIVDAVGAAHEAGVVHRDLKPANIIIDGRDGEPRVTDFGLAHDMGSLDQLTRAGDVLGTPAYMAPEQLRGEPVDTRADVYALGAILYQLVTGRIPFTGDTLGDLAHAIMRGDPTPPSQLNPLLPPAIEAVCLRALSKSAGDRPRTARDLGQELRRARSGGSASAILARFTGAHPDTNRALLVLGAGWVLSTVLLVAWGAWEHGRVVRSQRQSARQAAELTQAGLDQTELRAERDAAATRQEELEASLVGARRATERLRQANENLREDLLRASEQRAQEPAPPTQPLDRDRAASGDATARPAPRLARAIDRHLEDLERAGGHTYERARLLRNRGRYAEARALAEAALADGEQDLDLAVTLFRTCYAQGDQQAAGQIVVQLARDAPRSPQGLFARILLGQLEAGDDVVQSARRAVDMAPDRGYLRIFYARRAIEAALIDQDDASGWGTALEACDTAVAVDPTSPDALMDRASALGFLWERRLPLPGGSERDVAPLLLDDLRLASDLNPGLAELTLGEWCVRLGDHSLAREVLQSARDRADQAGDGQTSIRARAWLGRALLAEGDEAGAVGLWTEALRVHPGVPDGYAWVEVVDQLSPASRRELVTAAAGVEDYCREADRRGDAPLSVACRVCLGLLLLIQGDEPRAVEVWIQAIEAADPVLFSHLARESLHLLSPGGRQQIMRALPSEIASELRSRTRRRGA